MIPAATERLHVLLGYACNNNCIFCMEEDRVTRARRILEVPPQTVREMMERHRGGREIMFTSGEPLLNRHLLDYVRWARELGFETIGVITNGRLFTYERYARRLLEAGVNHIVVSVHGASERQHDALTRAPSSYAQTILGLRNLARLKRSYDLRLHTSTVVNARNLDSLVEIWESLRGLQIDQFIFNTLQPVGRAEAHFQRLMPRLPAVAEAFGKLVEHVRRRSPQAPDRAVGKLFLLDVPYCVTEALPGSARGFVERYQYYEHEDGLDDALLSGDDVDDDGVLRAMDTPDGGTLTLPGDDHAELHRLTRARLDETRKSKREACATCRYESMCDGVWNIYLDAFGWDEFQPVQASRADDETPETKNGAPLGGQGVRS